MAGMSLFGIAARFAAASAGANVAGQLVNKSMAPNHQVPVWQHAKGDTFLVLIQNRRAGHPESYELHAIENGHDRVVGFYGTSYPAAMAGCQQWHGCLSTAARCWPGCSYRWTAARDDRQI
jgi:hypothetical protein